MTEQWVGDILDGVSVIVVLLLVLVGLVWFYGRKISKQLDAADKNRKDKAE